MHEASIMQSVFDLAFAQMPDESMARIDRIRLRVGVLAGVVSEALEFAFEAMKPETPAANAKLEIERVTARLACRDCRAEFEPDGFPAACPTCGNWATEVLQGQELDLILVEFVREQ
jgi:hydrogenase nickel incorporation protein HypA/HybF